MAHGLDSFNEVLKEHWGPVIEHQLKCWRLEAALMEHIKEHKTISQADIRRIEKECGIEREDAEG
jgi:hypothetical protein